MPKTEKNGCAGLRNRTNGLDHRFGPIEHRPIQSLSIYGHNPRKHPERQLVKLANSIAEFGFVVPVLTDEEGIIIAGEARVAAAKRLGMSDVPVIVAHQWSKAQVRAYRLADNKLAELATWDADALAIELTAIIEMDDTSVEILGWESAEVDLILDGSARAEPCHDKADEQLEPPAVPVARPGDLWQLGEHRLLCASSHLAASWNELLADETAAMVFTDLARRMPAASLLYSPEEVRHPELAMAAGGMAQGSPAKIPTGFLNAMLRHLKDGAVLELCTDWRNIAALSDEIGAKGLSLLNLCVWNKGKAEKGSLYPSEHELVFVAKKGAAPHTNNVASGKRGQSRSDVWDYPGIAPLGGSRPADLTCEPMAKPVALVADAICDVTTPGEIVLDAFIGPGTTILAAEQTRRRAFGIECDPRYADVAIRRWEALTSEQAVLSGTGQSFAEVVIHRAQVETEIGVPSNAQSHQDQFKD